MGVSKDHFGWLNRIRTPFLFCHWMKPHISPVSSTTNEATKSLKNFPSVSASGNISLLFHCLIFAGKVQTWQPSGLSFPFENTLFVPTSIVLITFFGWKSFCELVLPTDLLKFRYSARETHKSWWTIRNLEHEWAPFQKALSSVHSPIDWRQREILQREATWTSTHKNDWNWWYP